MYFFQFQKIPPRVKFRHESDYFTKILTKSSFFLSVQSPPNPDPLKPPGLLSYRLLQPGNSSGNYLQTERRQKNSRHLVGYRDNAKRGCECIFKAPGGTL